MSGQRLRYGLLALLLGSSLASAQTAPEQGDKVQAVSAPLSPHDGPRSPDLDWPPAAKPAPTWPSADTPEVTPTPAPAPAPATTPVTPAPATPPPNAEKLPAPRLFPQEDPAHSAPAKPTTPPAVDPSSIFQAPPKDHSPVTIPPVMLGDLNTYTSGSPPVGTSLPLPTPRHPIAAFAGSDFKISQDESPLPLDRVFVSFNYFTSLDHPLRFATDPALRMAQETFGFEKTFLGGDASVGIRVPFFQFHDTAGGDISDFGDLTLVGKYWLINDRQSGWQLSTGLALTFSTGPVYPNPYTNQTISSGLVQPFVGYLWEHSDWYVQGFLSATVPTDSRVGTAAYFDIGLGYYVIRDLASVRAIVLTGEAHGTGSCDHNLGPAGAPTSVLNAFDVTAGVHFIFRPPVTLTFGVGSPLSGPRVYGAEYIIQCDYRF